MYFFQEPKLKILYSKGMLYEGMPTEFKFFFVSAIKALGDDLVNWPQDVKRWIEYNKKLTERVTKIRRLICFFLSISRDHHIHHRYQNKVKKFAEVVYDRGLAALQRNDDEFNVINHGDSWTNNMMYRYDENSKPIQHVFVSIAIFRNFAKTRKNKILVRGSILKIRVLENIMRIMQIKFDSILIFRY